MARHSPHSLTLHIARISHKTCWTFVEIRTQDGITGTGEATINGHESELVAAAGQFAPLVLNASTEDPGGFAASARPLGLPQAAMVSALDQALWDLHARHRQSSLAQVLGRRRDPIAVYANINRRTEIRTPDAFAQSARVAMAAGYQAFKVAPFDEVTPGLCAQGLGAQAMQAGLARVAAVRQAVGPGARLMVDCHWRFDETTASQLNAQAADFGVYWIECPVPETADNIGALVRLRGQANKLGMRLAGLEQNTGWETFAPFCEAGAYDVVMPDVKYAGGLLEMLRIAQHCERLGVAISPHNPSGPVCHAASLQFSSVTPAFDMLEVQFDESPLFDDLVSAPFAPVLSGHSAMPAGAGLGVVLNNALLSDHADRPSMIWLAN